jgi:hypothetical protein
MFVGRMILPEGGTTGPQRHQGPVGLYVESGVLSVVTPRGSVGRLESGGAAVLPADALLIASNEQAGDVSVLVVGAAPVDSPLFEQFIPTPTPTATMTPTITPTPSQTPIPTATLTPTPTATPNDLFTVASSYVAGGDAGFDDWDMAPNWKAVDGELQFTGTERDFASIEAPAHVVSTADYVVEAEVRVINAQVCSAFGISTRGDEVGSYNVAFNWLRADCEYNYMNSKGVGKGPRITVAPFDKEGAPLTSNSFCSEKYLSRTCPEYIAHAPFNPGTTWHTIRVEVVGSTIKVFVDGDFLLEGEDTLFVDGGTVGLWSNGAQFAVRRFAITQISG